MTPAAIIFLSLMGIVVIAKILGYIINNLANIGYTSNKHKNVVVIPPKDGAKERKKDEKFVDDVVLLDMVDEETDYTTFELME